MGCNHPVGSHDNFFESGVIFVEIDIATLDHVCDSNYVRLSRCHSSSQVGVVKIYVTRYDWDTSPLWLTFGTCLMNTLYKYDRSCCHADMLMLGLTSQCSQDMHVELDV